MPKPSDNQSTPDWLFEQLDTKYHFVWDVAADSTNTKVGTNFYGPGSFYSEDALDVDWPTNGWLWMNPPYSRGNQRMFVEKARAEAYKGARTLALLPSDTSTKLFHDLIYGAYKIEFLRRRLRFNGAANCAKFGSMLVEFKPYPK